MEKNQKGLNFLHLLTLVFAIAKLWEQVDWSWWAVFIPLYAGVFIAILEMVSERLNNKK